MAVDGFDGEIETQPCERDNADMLNADVETIQELSAEIERLRAELAVEKDLSELRRHDAERLHRWIKHIQGYCLTDKYAAQSSHINVPGFCELALKGEGIPPFYRREDTSPNCDEGKDDGAT